ncbi:hypothetical protein G7054_g4813 [Neopestalotiopsis clavispora]|nr:hypothetical protein G7054_g4813 [Neopestalotiopsis clavispora]
MSSATTTRTGSCLCGAIKVKVAGEPVFTNLCHCIDCQKATGSLFIACATFSVADVEYACAPADAMAEYQCLKTTTGSLLSRFFCRMCGSTVKNESAAARGKFVTVPLGILDDKSGLKPKYELFCANREDWFGDFDGVPRANGMEPVMEMAKAMAQGS